MLKRRLRVHAHCYADVANFDLSSERAEEQIAEAPIRAAELARPLNRLEDD